MEKVVNKKNELSHQENVIPKHVAIIMDGNRRWASAKNTQPSLGHREGVKALKKIVKYSHKIGVKYLTVYAFSTENWNRKKDEVEFLMFLVQDALKAEINELHSENIKLKFIGFHKELPGSLPEFLESAINKTKDNTGLNLQIALNYGSRLEITHAVKEIVKKVKNNELSVENISEETISNHLFTAGIPEPDLVIRTGGEFRLSNYLLWQSAYSEFYSTETLWPDFNEKELDKSIEEFNKRHRRFGV
jgi:undecaprenyl diphosphate synthase